MKSELTKRIDELLESIDIVRQTLLKLPQGHKTTEQEGAALSTLEDELDDLSNLTGSF